MKIDSIKFKTFILFLIHAIFFANVVTRLLLLLPFFVREFYSSKINVNKTSYAKMGEKI